METAENNIIELNESNEYSRSNLLKLTAKSLLIMLGVTSFSLSSFSIAKQMGKVELIDEITKSNELSQSQEEYYTNLRKEAWDSTTTPVTIMIGDIFAATSALIIVSRYKGNNNNN